MAPTPPEEPASTDPASDKGSLVIHILGSRGTYMRLRYDVYSVESQQVVFSGRGAREQRGEVPEPIELPPGLYKIVRAGEPFDTRVDYAIATVTAQARTEFLIVVDPDSREFRASGPVIGELPRGTEIAGVRLSLNAGGNILLDQRYNSVGSTSGTTSIIGLFGNFGLVFDKGNHLLDIGADLRLDLVDPVTGSYTPTHDRLQATALYSYKLNNPYIGPYVRVGLQTSIFPGYVYLQRDTPDGTATIRHLDGTTDTVTFGDEANPDDLRIRVSDPLAPLKLQEEIGANLKAVDLDLILFKLRVGTRIGFGFRQTFTNGLLVTRNEDANPVVFDEVDDYTTLGPVIGANASVTFARWLFARARFNALSPITNREDAGSSFGGRILMELAGTAGFKVPILTDLLYASADYTFRVERDGFIVNDTQFEHALMARATVTLF